MKIFSKVAIILTVLIVVFAALMLTGCGESEEPLYSNCPDGSVLANSTDVITSNPDQTVEWEVLGGVGLPLGVRFSGPITFLVHDSAGNPRNKVCISFTTDGTWYTDENLTEVQVGEGAWNRITVETDPSGAAVLYWRTEPIPASAPATSSGGSASAGIDQSDRSQIYAHSGVIADTFNYDWTVKGCADTTYGPPSTCP